MNRATNAATMRASNRRLILNLIRLKPISRVELSERTRLTRASLTQIVDELIAEGLVETASTEARGTLGRRRTQLALRRDARLVFGVNIRRRHCWVGAINLYGEVRAQQGISLADRTAPQAMEEIASVIRAQAAALDLPPERIAGICPSAISSRRARACARCWRRTRTPGRWRRSISARRWTSPISCWCRSTTAWAPA